MRKIVAALGLALVACGEPDAAAPRPLWQIQREAAAEKAARQRRAIVAREQTRFCTAEQAAFWAEMERPGVLVESVSREDDTAEIVASEPLWEALTEERHDRLSRWAALCLDPTHTTRFVVWRAHSGAKLAHWDLARALGGAWPRGSSVTR